MTTVKSRITAVSSCPVRYRAEHHMPQRHLLAPQSLYPIYETDALGPGEYVFASCADFTCGGEHIQPEISLSGGTVTVRYSGREYILDTSEGGT